MSLLSAVFFSEGKLPGTMKKTCIHYYLGMFLCVECESEMGMHFLMWQCLLNISIKAISTGILQLICTNITSPVLF